MIIVRPAGQRGQTTLDWLDSRHTFSFSNYQDNEHMNFGPLRVINEDIVAPGKGFNTHSHDNMEIITYVIDGTIEHRDSLNSNAVIHTEEIQQMSAGTGITHSEFNHSMTKPVHFLQIWIIPNKHGLRPSYEQKKLDFIPNQWQVVADNTGKNGALKIQQDVTLLAADILNKQKLLYSPIKGTAWLQVVKGSITIGDIHAEAGDGIAFTNEPDINISANANSKILLFDIPTI